MIVTPSQLQPQVPTLDLPMPSLYWNSIFSALCPWPLSPSPSPSPFHPFLYIESPSKLIPWPCFHPCITLVVDKYAILHVCYSGLTLVHQLWVDSSTISMLYIFDKLSPIIHTLRWEMKIPSGFMNRIPYIFASKTFQTRGIWSHCGSQLRLVT